VRRFVLNLIIISTFLWSCGDSPTHPVPYVPVNEVVYLSTPSGYPLQFIGGTVVLPDAGVRGIAVHRRMLQGTVDDFGAFDLCCPNHVQPACGALELEDNLYAVCPCDGQRFLLFDGQALDGSSTYSLLPYSVGFDGNALRIRSR
jgi:nitrite reductase/ring-hydroxylating ferredoxin subunit